MMRAFRSLAAVLAKLALREPLGVFFTLLLPAGLVALFGLAFGNAPIPLGEGRGGMDHQLPAIAAWVFAMTGLFTVPMALLGRRDAGTLRRFQVTPLRPATYLAADIVVHLGQALLGIALLFAVGAWAFGARGGGSPLVVVGAAQLNPLYHAVTLLRGAWFGESWSAVAGSAAAVIAGLLVVAAAFAAWRFRWEA
ncbi:MAG: ABC transporter permease [Trueperaceae bacterium]|nr:ABC transporter permease [Trueperaceae bacterium]